MFFYLEPARAIINDINPKLMSFYLGVRNYYDTLRTELAEIERQYTANRLRFEELKRETPNQRVNDENEHLYYQIRDMFNERAERRYSDALLYYFINKTAYSGMIRYNARGEFNVPYGRYANLNTSLVTRPHSELLANADILNLDYSEIFNMVDADDFVFLDPPYDCVFSDYGNIEHQDNGFNERSHRELANNYRNLGCRALMVIGKTPLTEELYRDMIVDEYGKSYSVNIRNRFKSIATHIIVSNYHNA